MIHFIHNNAMLISGLILLIAYVFIASERIQKSVVALAGASVAMLMGFISFEGYYDVTTSTYIKGLFDYIDFQVIFLLIGMMIIVHISSRSGVFKWLAIEILHLTKGHPKTVLFALASFTAIASAFLDNVTTVVLMMPVTFIIAKEFDTDPVPFLITEVIASNIGGTTTLIGDPPNIIIGTKAGLTFMDFLRELTPIVTIILNTVAFGNTIQKKAMIPTATTIVHSLNLFASADVGAFSPHSVESQNVISPISEGTNPKTLFPVFIFSNCSLRILSCLSSISIIRNQF